MNREAVLTVHLMMKRNRYFFFVILSIAATRLSAQEPVLSNTLSSKLEPSLNTPRNFTTPAIDLPDPVFNAIFQQQADSMLPGDRFTATLTPQQKKRRIRFVAGANIIGYSTAMIGLYSAWYKDYPRTGFHTFNDWPEWKQVDKVGHFYSAYIESRASMELWRWTGIERKKRIWLGGMSGAVYQTVIEVLDGYSAGWGWSWGDFGANILGSGTLVAQEFAFGYQPVKFKFSFHRKTYGDPVLNQRSDDLFGTSLAQRFIKDYNGQTYWASANLRSIFSRSKIPSWLAISVGYGADGMFGGRENLGKDEQGNITFNRPDIKRYRQWYLAPDIDLSEIHVKSKAVRFLFTVLSAFKFPAPALEFSKGKFRLHGIYF